MGSCQGRIALVTGGSRGIGRATALRLAYEGADVALVARDVSGERLGRSLAATVDEVRAVGVRAIAIAADLTDPTIKRAAVIEEAEAQLGPIDILVNNAAMSVFQNVTEWTPAKVRRMFEVNVMAPWELISAAVPGMIERGRGWIVNISASVANEDHARPGGAAYGGTKAMLDQMTRCLALELAGTSVIANCLSPQGASATEFVEKLVAGGSLGAELLMPLEVMAEAVLAFATAPPTVSGAVVCDLDLLNELGRPVRTLDGRGVVAGYDVADLPARIAGLAGASSRGRDLRGAWGRHWTQSSSA